MKSSVSVVGGFNSGITLNVPHRLRAYPNNRVVMKPSEKFEAKAAGAKSPQA